MRNCGTPSKEVLEDLYLNKKMTMKEVSQELDMATGKIHKYIHIYGIKPRPIPYKEMGKRSAEVNKGKAYRKGKHCSEETKEKLRQSHLGKYTSLSEYGAHEKKRSDGYISVYCPNHPGATKDGYVMKHRLVMERHIGRYLKDDEVVHHKNGNRADNRLENLELMTFKEHARHHMIERHNKRKEVLTY